MKGKKILLGIIEDKEAFLMVQLAYKLRDIGYDAYIFRTEISDNYIPLAYMEDLLTYKKDGWDLLVIGPGNEDTMRYNPDQALKDLAESSDVDIIIAEDLDDLDLIIEKIQVGTKGYNLQEYSFLFTLGYFNEHLTNNHFIGTYRNDQLINGLIKILVLSGANVSIIASKNIGRVAYAEDVVYVNDRDELDTVLNSKFFKYDFVINAINIPRFGLAKGERFKIEYQRYFAEFDEKYLPFIDEGLSSNNQLIIEVINGSIDNEEAIKYLFENSCVNIVMLSEIDKESNEFKPFIKLISRDGSADIIAFRDNRIMYNELINELKSKIEG
jgi:hypothetical protein